MKEIEITELNKYVDPLSIGNDPAIVMVSDGNETNGMTIGWAGFGVLWKKLMATVYIHKLRYSKHIFDNAKYFAICFMKPEHKEIVKYFGTASGKNENKIERCGLEIINDTAPYFKDSRVAVICRKMGQSDFDINHVDEGVEAWYQKDGVHSQYYGEIVKVYVSD
ncbi:MAG: flavin reductase [Erysipelotrichaceae bacterium]|nr:flavin reductase [Erysipelotrichaceae bacterium]